MKLTERVYMVGSGGAGFSLTDPSDCHIYLVDGKSELALIDAGTGAGQAEIMDIIRSHGFDPTAIRHLFLTHLHADHAGGAAGLYKEIPNLSVLAAREVADDLRTGDEEAIGLTMGKKGGYYDPDYRFEPCPVDVELVEGQVVQVGDLQIKALDTPGHCAGHMTFIMVDTDQTYMFSGDNLFFGGKILLQPIPDCDVQVHLDSIDKLVGLGVDVFLPGHGCISLKDGQRHIDAAAAWRERCLIPPSFI